jgi:hypothetical protein
MKTKKKFLAGGLAALSITGGSVAVAAISPFSAANAQSDGGTATTETPAARHGARLEALAPLVEDGTITQAQADAVKARLQELAPKGGHRGGHAMKGAGMDEVATFLGLSAEELHGELRSGKTLAELAGDRVDALVEQLVAAANARIDQAVTDGKLTAEKAEELKANTAERITKMVNCELPARGPGGGHGPRGF